MMVESEAWTASTYALLSKWMTQSRDLEKHLMFFMPLGDEWGILAGEINRE